MEPFPKRQRLYSPIGPTFPQSFDSEQAYYDEDELDDFIVEEEEEEKEVEDAQLDYDPESDLQQKRARLDYKLKSTFEAIFEKYGKDFDGVGDEIDLATGEIVVNNGHILEMLDERDAGDVGRAQSVPTEVTEESEDLPSSALEEEVSEIDEEDEELEDEGSEEGSDDDMLEDDMILRGFSQANRFLRASPELGTLRKPVVPQPKPRKVPVQPPVVPKKSLPSRSEILAQFGPKLGPQIVEYVSKQSVPKDSHVEPAWRAPEIPAFEPRRRESKKHVVLPPEPERSPSPEEATSIWALPRGRGPNKVRPNNVANFRGESSAGIKHQDRFALDPLSLPLDLGDFDQISPPKRRRNKFTDEDDQVLLDWVTRVRQKGLTLSDPLWKELEANCPSHPWQMWKKRYKHHFTYLLSNSTEESEVSEASVDSPYVAPQPIPVRHADPLSHGLSQDSMHVRPNRVRKPAQKDSRIITWSEAVDALESLDPDLHAGIMEDSRMENTSHPTFGQPSFTSSRQDLRPATTTKPAGQHAVHHAPKPRPKEVIDLTDLDDELSDVEAAPVQDQDQSLIPGAPCPHAECRAYPTILYRLQRRDEEELSEMCLHLFRVHHTTPFPCGETNCTRKGEEGYFMQADLVRHARNAHPSVGALHRLRGRVDSELLDRNIELATPPSDSIRNSNRPVSQQRDSDFMSPRKASTARRLSSSQMRSSTSDPDRTPRGLNTIPGASHSTPMTSVSSMRVHHPSATKAPAEQEFDNDNMDSIDNLSMQAHRSTIDSSGGLGSLHVQRPSSLGAAWSNNGAETYSKIRNPLPTPVTATDSSLGPALSFFDDKKARRRNTISEQEPQIAKPPTSSISQKPGAIINETPDPVFPQVQGSSQEIPSTSFASSSNISTSRLTRRAQPPIRRNTIDPTYEFSDEEVQPRPVSKAPPRKLGQISVPKPAAAVPSMGPPSSAPKRARIAKTPITMYSKKQPRVVKSAPAPKLSFTTPAAQKAIRQSILRMALDAEDFDELSLNKEDVVLIFSQPRTKPLSKLHTIVKQEDVMNTPRPVSSAANRKRAFSTFQERSSPDELAEEQLSPSSKAAATAKPQIKVEEDVSLPAHPPTLPNHKQDKGKQRADPLPSSHMTPSISGRQIPIRTNTPLLNLTPSAPKEIRDSAGEESSPALPNQNSPPQRARTRRQRAADSSSSPLTNLLTPTRKKTTNDFLMAEQVTVVVKTPGGTFRRCGEDGFSCGRSFCFRCGNQGVVGNAAVG
ncbi:uncharacterized protein PAC_05351 [Phialocephala subalpina]|uniref:TERF2-interacting telomeric protein 1 Myb domain-containing protein n=1 Tax=Phialocephala subalpina TaxID=576137 RepID=A0A1L7WRS6_9HELO|nr:uncharacterized protein PAC_05351 [Phialocephala subalpina]